MNVLEFLGIMRNGAFNLVFWFYIPNIIMVTTDICIYFRNKKIEASGESCSNSADKNIAPEKNKR